MAFKPSRYGPSRWSGPYWMPGRLRDWLNKQLGEKETPAHVLARFLARFHAGPRTWGRRFVICRVALAKVAELGLTEKQIRLAIARLEQIGFIARTTGVEWRRRSGGCQRSPILWRFAGVAASMLAFMLRSKRVGPEYIANARKINFIRNQESSASGAIHSGPGALGASPGGFGTGIGWGFVQPMGEA